MKRKEYSISMIMKKLLSFFVIMFLFFTQNAYAVIDVGVSFSKSSADLGEEIDYTITINNSSEFDSTNANFTHNLPDGVKIADVPDIRSTCGSTDVIQTENVGEHGVIKMVNGTVPGTASNTTGSCNIKVKVLQTKVGNKVSEFPLNSYVGMNNGVQETNNVGDASTSTINSNQLNQVEIELKGYKKKMSKNVYFYSQDDQLVELELRNKLNDVDIKLEGLEVYLPLGTKLVDGTVSNTCGNDNITIEEKDLNSYQNFDNFQSYVSKTGSDLIDKGKHKYIKFNSGSIPKKGSCFLSFKFSNNLTGTTVSTRTEFSKIRNRGFLSSEDILTDYIHGRLSFVGKNPRDGSQKSDFIVNDQVGSLYIYNHGATLKYSKGLGVYVIVGNDNFVNIIDGEGVKKIRYLFSNGDFENKQANFTNTLPTVKGGTSQMIFNRVVENTCQGSTITGEGTNTFNLNNLNLLGGKNFSDEELYSKLSISGMASKSCYVDVEVKITEPGEYKLNLNHKDQNLISGIDNSDNIDNLKLADGGYSQRIIGIESNGVTIDKYAGSGENGEKQNTLHINGSNPFYEVYELNNIANSDLFLNINSKTNYTLDGIGSQVKLKIMGIETEGDGCIGTGEIGEDLSGKSKITGLKIRQGSSCKLKIKKRIVGDLTNQIGKRRTVAYGGQMRTDRNALSLEESEIETSKNGADFTGNKNTKDNNQLIIYPGIYLNFGEIFNKTELQFGKKFLDVLNITKKTERNKPIKFKDFRIKYGHFIGDHFTIEEIGDLIHYNSKFNGTVRLENGEIILNGEFSQDLQKNNREDYSIITIPLVVKVKDGGAQDSEELSNGSNNQYDMWFNEIRTTPVYENGYGEDVFGYNYSNQKATLRKNIDYQIETLREFDRESINGGGIAKLKITFNNKDNRFRGFVFDLNENLGNFKIKKGSEIKTECNGTQNLEKAQISDDGRSLTLNNGYLRMQGGTKCSLILEVTSVHGGNQIQTGGNNYVSHSSNTFTESSDSLLVLRNINAISSFEKTSIKEGETTEYYLELLNSQLVNETLQEFRKTFDKRIDLELLDNQCGGDIRIDKSNGTSTLVMSGQQINAESSCLIKFRATGKESGTINADIRNGEIRTESGKVNVDSTSSSLRINQGNTIQLIGNTEDLKIGKKKNMIIRIKRDNSGDISKDMTGIEFGFKIPQGLRVNVSTDERIGNDTLREQGISNNFVSCQNLHTNNRYAVNDSGNHLDRVGNLPSVLPANRSYCDILLEVIGEGIGEKRFFSQLDFDGKEINTIISSNEFMFNVINRTVVTKFLDVNGNNKLKEDVEGTDEIEKEDFQYYEYLRTDRSEEQGKEIVKHIYQKKRGKITINYIGESPSLNGSTSSIETLRTEEITGLEEGTDFDYRERKNVNFDNYDLDNSLDYETSLKGIVEGDKTLTIKYNKGIGVVKVKYVEGDGTDNIINNNFQPEYSERKLVGDRYDVSGKRTEIRGYDLYKTTGQENGNVGKNETVVTHYYKKKTIPVRITYVESLEGGNEISASETYEENKKYGDQFDFTNLVNKNIKYLNKVSHDLNGIDNLTGTVGEEDINIKVVYKRKKADIIVSFLDSETNGEIKDSVTFEKELGKEYSLDEGNNQIPEGYNYDRTSGEINGILTEERGLRIIHYYTHKKGRVITKHLDYNTNQSIDQDEIVTKNTGSEHTTNHKDNVEGYTFKGIKDGDNETVQIQGEEDYTVTYYYVKNNRIDLTVNYVDEDGNTISKSEIVKKTKTGYDANDKKKEITNYTFTEVKDGNQLSCDSIECLDKDSITLKYTRKTSTYTIIYKDSETGEEIKREERVLKVGDNYDIDGNSIENFDFTRTEGGENLNGDVTEGDKEINVIMTRKKGTLRVRFLNKDDMSMIIPEKEHEVGIGKEFETEYNAGADFIENLNRHYNFDSKQGDFDININNDGRTISINKMINGNLEEISLIFSKKDSEIVVKYIDEDTNNEIADKITLSKKFGEEYTTEQKQINTYTFTRSEGVLNGTVENENINVTYFYRKNNGTVLVKYIDELTNNEISGRDTIENKIGTNYSSDHKEIENYIFVRSENNNGVIGEDQKEVVHYYQKKRGSIEIDIIDQETGEIVTTKRIEGFVGDNYNITDSIGVVNHYGFGSFNGGIENTGLITEGNKKISVNYIRKKGNVVIQYINQEDGSIIKEDVIDKKDGEQFDPDNYELHGYTAHSKEGLNGGIVREGNGNIIKFFYTRNSGRTIVKFNDQNGKKIKDNLVIEGKFGDVYDIKFDIPEGFNFKRINGSTKGKIDGEQTITIEFSEKEKVQNVSSGPGGYAPTKDINLKDDNRVTIQPKITIIEKNEDKDNIKKEENNKYNDKDLNNKINENNKTNDDIKDNKRIEILELKEKPMIILGDPKYEIIDVNNTEDSSNNKNIRLPKTGIDGDFIKKVEEMILSNSYIKEEDSSELLKEFLDIAYENGITGVKDDIEIILDKENSKTIYKFNAEKTEENLENGKAIIYEIPITVSIDTKFEDNQDKNNSFNIYYLIGIISTILGIIAISYFFFIRKRTS